MELSSKHLSLSLFGCFLVLARAKLKICHALIPTLEEKESSKSCQPDIVPTWTQQTESTFLVSFENRVACLCVFPANVGSFGVPQADLMLTMSIAGAGVVLGYKRSHCSILVDWCRMFCHLCRLRCRRNGRTSHLLLFPCPLTRRVWRDRTNDSGGGGGIIMDAQGRMAVLASILHHLSHVFVAGFEVGGTLVVITSILVHTYFSDSSRLPVQGTTAYEDSNCWRATTTTTIAA